MKIFSQAAALLLCAAATLSVLSGCASGQNVSSSKGESSASGASAAPSGSSVAPVVSAAPEDPDARLPLEDYTYRAAELENYRTMGAQFYTEFMDAAVREVPYDIAAAIYNYRDFQNALIFTEDFSDILSLDPAVLIEIAVSRAPHIDQFSAAFRCAKENRVKAFFEDEKRAGRELSLLSYGDDVRATAQKLFGENYKLPGQDGLRMRYNESLDLYYLDTASAALSTDYPVIVEWKREGDTYTARAIRLSFWEFRCSWSTPDGSWESSENCDIDEVHSYVNANFSAFPQDTYILRGNDRDSLRLVGFRKG